MEQPQQLPNSTGESILDDTDTALIETGGDIVSLSFGSYCGSTLTVLGLATSTSIMEMSILFSSEEVRSVLGAFSPLVLGAKLCRFSQTQTERQFLSCSSQTPIVQGKRVATLWY